MLSVAVLWGCRCFQLRLGQRIRTLGQASGDALLAPAMLSWPSLVGAQKGSTSPNIEQLMTDEQFRALGLTKFSLQERRALNQWVYAYTQAVAKATTHLLDGSMSRRP